MKASLFLALLGLITIGTCHEDGSSENHDHDEKQESSLVKSTKPWPPPQKKDICLTKHCIAASNRIFEFMNSQVDPCQDFNEFACGGFIANKIIPDDKSRWDAFGEIAEKIDQQGRKLLEAPIDEKKDFKADMLVKTFYKSCMNEETLNKMGIEPVEKILEQLGGWPVVLGDKWAQDNFDLWGQNQAVFKLGYSNDYIVGTSIQADSKNSSYRVLYLDQANLGLKKEFWDKGIDEPEVRAYFKLMLDTSVLFGAEKSQAEQEMSKVVDFEMKLANISAAKEARRNKTQLYNPTTLGEFPTGPSLPESWTAYFAKLFEFEGQAEKITVDDSEKVIISDVHFFKNLSTLLNSTDKRTLANYMSWRVVFASMNYLGKNERALRHSYNKVLTGVDQEKANWKRCTNKAGFNNLRDSSTFVYAVSSIYARYIFDKKAKSKMEEMTKYIRKAFAQILDELSWMDEETKVEARKKLKKMKQFIAYPDDFLDQEKVDGVYQGLEIKADDYLGNVLRLTRHYEYLNVLKLRQPVDVDDWTEHKYVAIVNAFYNPSFNNFEFPAGILQGAFFHPEVPNYMNYGGIGFVIGHEITHGFDDQGRQRDSDGSLVNWWRPETNQKFKEKAQCIIWQYGNYTSKQVDMNLNGVNTQGENIADNGGIKEAYLGYEKWVEVHGVEPGLPGHPFSSKQLFWISAAQSWCAKYRNEKMRNQILTGFHSPPEFRIKGPMSNNENFAKDFNCPLGSPMNPDKKCVVW